MVPKLGTTIREGCLTCAVFPPCKVSLGIPRLSAVDLGEVLKSKGHLDMKVQDHA